MIRTVGSLGFLFLSEMMFPSMDGGTYVPKPAGQPFVPAFMASQVGLDYEVAQSFRVFYLQKALAIWPAQPGGRFGGRFLDPRIGVRKTDVFAVDGLSTEYDLFVQPGLQPAFVIQPQRAFDLGIRLTHRYGIPRSRFTLGLNVEMVWTSHSVDSVSSYLTGVVAPWASYRISESFATQHWIYGFYKHMRADDFGSFSWDITGMPYIQNGITMKLSEQMSLSALINNYLFVVPTLKTTWSSLWFAFRL